MSERTKFWILIVLLGLSIVLLLTLNSSANDVLIGQ